MSDDTPTDTTDSDKNFEALRKQREAAEERAVEAEAKARELEAKDTIREMGFDPAADKGAALMKLARANSDTDLREEAQGFGWLDGDGQAVGATAPAPNPNPTPNPAEQAALAGAQQVQGLQQVGTSQTPASADDQIKEANAAIAAAVDAGDNTARIQGVERLNRLNAEKLVAEMREKRK